MVIHLEIENSSIVRDYDSIFRTMFNHFPVEIKSPHFLKNNKTIKKYCK